MKLVRLRRNVRDGPFQCLSYGHPDTLPTFIHTYAIRIWINVRHWVPDDFISLYMIDIRNRETGQST